ncbi:MAG: hypothetical protein D6677_06120 [Calditrichaeota bacterium]|nr:MAG: hypothetical protein D6677_06120 [Calditrichota bacterium]
MQRIDLKNLIRLIDDQKDIETNLILDEGCVIEAENQTALIKVINYIFNYLGAQTQQPLEISLDLMHDGCLLNFMAFTEKSPDTPLSPNVEEALKAYKGTVSLVEENGKYLQVKIHFAS